MTEKTLRYTHDAKFNQSPGVKRRSKSAEATQPAQTTAPPAVKQEPVAISNPVRDRLHERHNRILAKKESYKQLVVHAF